MHRVAVDPSRKLFRHCHGVDRRRAVGARPACADQLCYTAATDSNEGKLSRDEEAVRDDERKYGGYADHLEHTSIATRHGLLSGGRRGHRSFDDRYSNIIRCIAVD
jgi:hypothetical protein